MEFDPQTGHEQRGKRPALVVSNNFFNRMTNLAMVCPITNTNNHFPLHVELDMGITTTGVVLCEQLKSLDVLARGAVFKEKVSADILQEVLTRVCLSVE